MEQTALMKTLQRRGYADGNAQKQVQFPWFAEQTRKHLPAVIFNEQRRFSVVMNELQGPCRPGWIELTSQFIRVFQARAAARRGLAYCRGQHQDRAGLIGFGAPRQKELPVVP